VLPVINDTWKIYCFPGCHGIAVLRQIGNANPALRKLKRTSSPKFANKAGEKYKWRGKFYDE
jgi:hypothetical protein